jgi:hypothetical protein
LGIALDDQLTAPALGGTANAGLAGASLQISPAEKEHGKIRFSFTTPATGAGSANGDQVRIGDLNVLARIVRITFYTAGLGAGVTIALGKIDPNNAANTDPVHYMGFLDASVLARLEADTNLLEQVGATPSGASTDTGDGLNPGAAGGGFGNAPIRLVATIGGAAPTAATTFQGLIEYMGPDTYE